MKIIFIVIFFISLISCKDVVLSTEKPDGNVNVVLESLGTYATFNNQICKQDASIILFSKDMICNQNLLNPTMPLVRFPLSGGNNSRDERIPRPLPGEPISYAVSVDTFTNVCKQPLTCNNQLVGYYIELTDSINTTSNVKLKFFPVWTNPSQSGLREIIGSPIIVSPDGLALSSNIQNITPTQGLTIPVIPYSPLALGQGFQHSSLQFHSNAVKDKFMRAYISWYELKLIIENCQHFGIVGALVGTGNFKVVEWGQSKEGDIFQTCNKFFFTYRFIGFNEYWVDKTKLVPASFSNTEKAADGVGSFNPSIPTETWAVPCPPMWKPSN